MLENLQIPINLFFQSLGIWLAPIMQFFSFLGTEEFFLIVMPALYWSVDPRLGMRLGWMLVLTNWVNGMAKLAFHAPRPYWVSTEVKALSSETSFGMPSGHAQNAAALWGLTSTRVIWRWFRWLSLAIIVLIGLSRIYLGMHFAGDVLAGWAIGAVLVWLFVRLEPAILHWADRQSLRNLGMVIFLASLVVIAGITLSNVLLGDWTLPTEWMNTAQQQTPETPIDPRNIEGGFTLGGILFGFGTGSVWLIRRGKIPSGGTWEQRLLRYLLGLSGLFILWYGLGKIFPDDASAISYILRYIRYALIGSWVSVFAPIFFRKLHLVK
jgi:membrane-associated phospholipid phosphatase